MSIPVNIGGNTYNVPETGEVRWGPVTTSILVDLANLKLDFPLLNELDLGSLYGVTSLHFKSRSTNVASAGVLRLSSTDLIAWRNNANTADIYLAKNGSDELTFNGAVVGDTKAIWGNISGTLSAQTDLQTALNNKAALVHTHTKSQITDFSDADYATAAQGLLADSAVQPGDNVSVLLDDGTYALVIHTHTKSQITDFSDSDYATAAQGLLADSATQPGDNVSTLTNDAGYLNGTTGVEPGDNVSTLTNDAGYISNITGQSIKDLSDVFSTMVPVDGQVLTYSSVNGWQAEVPPGGLGSPAVFITDHTELTSIGVNTHAQIDSHISDSTIHFTAASLNLDSKADLIGSPAVVPDSQISQSSVVQYESALTITESQISDLGPYEPAFTKNTAFNKDFGVGSPQVARGNHLHTGVYEPANANIQSHISDSTIHFTQGAISIPASQITDFNTVAASVADGQIALASINDLADVQANGSPLTIGQHLTWDGLNWINSDQTAVLTDHTQLTSIGVNTHAQIDSHISDSTIHFTADSLNLNTKADLIGSPGVVPDSQISQSSVTQHQSALTITESQISDLQAYTLPGDNISVFTNDAGYLTDITSQSIKDLTDVLSTMTPNENDVLTWDNVAGRWQSEPIPPGITDHTLLSNIGVNTHAQIDTHIADSTIHFTEASIDHTAILNIGSNTHAQIDTHIADSSIHYAKSSINLSDLGNVVTNGSPALTTGDLIQFDGANWINIPSDSVGVTDHTLLSNIGVNSHTLIDSHIADTSIHFGEEYTSVDVVSSEAISSSSPLRYVANCVNTISTNVIITLNGASSTPAASEGQIVIITRQGRGQVTIGSDNANDARINNSYASFVLPKIGSTVIAVCNDGNNWSLTGDYDSKQGSFVDGIRTNGNIILQRDISVMPAATFLGMAEPASSGFTFSCWFTIPPSGGVLLAAYDNTSTDSIAIGIQDQGFGPQAFIEITGNDGSGPFPFFEASNLDLLASSDWHHLVCSRMGTNPASSQVVEYVYIDGQDASGNNAWGGVLNYQTMDEWAILTGTPNHPNWGTGSIYDGHLAEMWMSNEFVDLSVQANLELFIKEDLDNPGTYYSPGLGENGEKPTGQRPLIYLFANDTTFANYSYNKGTGGDFVKSGSSFLPNNIGPVEVIL